MPVGGRVVQDVTEVTLPWAAAAAAGGGADK